MIFINQIVHMKDGFFTLSNKKTQRRVNDDYNTGLFNGLY